MRCCGCRVGHPNERGDEDAEVEWRNRRTEEDQGKKRRKTSQETPQLPPAPPTIHPLSHSLALTLLARATFHPVTGWGVAEDEREERRSIGNAAMEVGGEWTGECGRDGLTGEK